MRIGHGFDAHAFQKGRKLILAGVEIPHAMGLAGHSDADVVIHAVCDALLGASALGDIGQYFPSDAKEWKNFDSRVFLRNTHDLLTDSHFKISNIDVTIIAQVPKLLPHREAMRTNLAEDLRLNIHQVSVKATTTDGMGFVGREEGIAAHAVTIIQLI